MDLKGDKTISELISHLNSKEVVQKDVKEYRYRRKVEELFHLIFEISEERVWGYEKESENRKCGIGLEKKSYKTFVGSKRVEVVSVKDKKPDLTEVLRIKLIIKENNKTLFQIICVYDFYHVEYIPRNSNADIRHFSQTLLKLFEILEKENKTP